ncbi:MAG: NUDIX hydrolase [Fibrobacterota bacterium]
MEEFLDICRRDGSLTGETVSRRTAHQEGILHRTVHLWVKTPGGLLLQKRSPVKESHPGLWDISAAGHVPAGEELRISACRECAEELGLNVVPQDLQECGTLLQEFSFPEKNFFDREYVAIYAVFMNVDADACRLQKSEVADVRDISPREFRAVVARRDSSLVPHWCEYEKIMRILLDTEKSDSVY